LHHWQQALDPMQQIVAMVSKPNDLVCDPFSDRPRQVRWSP